ncbi:MAG TPA: choice-of-anchor D domain-containing protein, partial [Polyangia bacterium]|nr:choice-of-anchor D domain-containing protein [Polyangia bacterium]
MTTCSKNFDRLLQAACLGLVGMLAVAGCGGSSSNPAVDASRAPDGPGSIPGLDGAVLPSTLTIDKVSVPFGSVDVGATSVTQVVTVTNTGSQAVAIVPTISGSGAFSITDTCASVPKSGNCTISVVFQPTAVGKVSGVLSISSTLAVSLSGTGVAQGSFSVPGVDLGSKVATGASVTGAVTVTATVAVTDLTCSVSGSDLTADAAKVCPTALAANASCTVGFTFKATSPGSKTDSVVCSAAGSTKTALVTATVLDPAKLVISPTSTTFQTPTATQSDPVAFGVANTGGLPTGPISATLTGSNADQFAIATPGCLTPLAGAAGCSLQVVCKPTTVGTKSASLQIADSSGAATSVTAALTCVSVGPATLTVTGTANLGSALIGSTGTAQTFTVKNTGTTASGALALTVTDPEFVMSADTCTGISVPAAGTCTVNVALKPAAAGALTAVLSVSAPSGNPGS